MYLRQKLVGRGQLHDVGVGTLAVEARAYVNVVA